MDETSSLLTLIFWNRQARKKEHKPLGQSGPTKPSLRSQVGQELGMADDSGKHWQVFLEREPLFFGGERRCAVSERNHSEALLVAGTSRRFHTTIGQES